MSPMILAASVLLTLAAIADATDVVILKNGVVLFGKIQSQDFEGLKIQRGTNASVITYPNALVVQVYERRGGLPPSAHFALPSWGRTLESLSGREWAGNVKQIPATVVDKGILRNVPYMSFRCGIDYEINIYGDPDNPSGIEIGIYRSLLKIPQARENCIALAADIIATGPVNDAVKNAQRDKGKTEIKEWTVEVTPPEGKDSYGGWWLSIYSEKALDSSRASARELAQLTVAKTQIAQSTNQMSGWSPDDLKSARSATPAPDASVDAKAPNRNTGRVYGQGYTRRDGVYVTRQLLRLLR